MSATRRPATSVALPWPPPRRASMWPSPSAASLGVPQRRPRSQPRRHRPPFRRPRRRRRCRSPASPTHSAPRPCPRRGAGARWPWARRPPSSARAFWPVACSRRASSTPRTSPSRTAQPVPSESTGASESEPDPQDETARPHEPDTAAGFTTFEADTFTAEYPAAVASDRGRRAQDHLQPDEVHEPRRLGVNPRSTAVPERTSPRPRAQRLWSVTPRRRPATSGSRSRPTTLGGREAFEWAFALDGERKVDIFLNAGGDGFAVLGEGGQDFEVVLAQTRRVAASIQPR